MARAGFIVGVVAAIAVSGAAVLVAAPFSGTVAVTPDGAVTPGSYVSVTASRVLDTRNGTGVAHPAALPAGATLSLLVEGPGEVPASGVSSVVLTVAATEPTEGGFISVWADGSTRPGSSNLNFAPGQSVSNLVVAPVGADGKVDLYNGSAGTVQLVADMSGYYLATPPTA